jgi:hypothetical protein
MLLPAVALIAAEPELTPAPKVILLVDPVAFRVMIPLEAVLIAPVVVSEPAFFRLIVPVPVSLTVPILNPLLLASTRLIFPVPLVAANPDI